MISEDKVNIGPPSRAKYFEEDDNATKKIKENIVPDVLIYFQDINIRIPRVYTWSFRNQTSWLARKYPY